MNTFWIVVIVLAIDYGLGVIIKFKNKAKRSKEVHAFDKQLGHIFDSNISMEKKLEEAKDLCRNTVGEEGAGAYFLIDYVQKHSSK
jgi:L-asparaginase II